MEGNSLRVACKCNGDFGARITGKEWWKSDFLDFFRVLVQI